MKIIGYADEISVAPGETIRFHVSCDGPKSYRADIVRIICGDENPAGPGYKEEVVRTAANKRYRGRKQEILIGSYGVVQHRPALSDIASFTVQAMIWPTTPHKGEQTIIAKWSARERRGFQLLIDAGGALALRIGDGVAVATVSTGTALLEREWYLVAASYDSRTGAVTVRQEAQVRRAFETPVGKGAAKVRLRLDDLGTAPLMFAAHTSGSLKGRLRTAGHYNGKIDAPRLANRVLDRAEMMALQHGPLVGDLRYAVVGAWDFSRDIATGHLRDVSGNCLHGETVNLPARGMTGHNWDRSEMCWKHAPDQYGAIHFHDDDLYDCGWEESFALTIPRTMRSGCYAARLSAGGDEDYIPFFVRPPRGTATATIAFLASTASYMAYGNYLFVFDFPVVELLTDRVLTIYPWEEHLKKHPELAGSMYECHSDGSGICYSSRLRPLINHRPKAKLSLAATGSELWGYNADTHLTDWLDAQGFAFDVITDEDLEAEGAQLLKPYRAVLTGTHPEYVSTAMWDAIHAYTDQGGRLMYMGGNGFYWHIAYHPRLPGVIEVRRTEGSTRAWKADPGEDYHSFTGQYGGLLRHQGRTPNILTGAGFTAQGFDFSIGYRRTAASLDPRIAWAFEGIGENEAIGDFGLIGNGAAGLEVDCADRTLGTPRHALVVARADELSDTFMLVPEQSLVPMPDQLGTMHDQIRADLVFHETPNGGAVFAFSSMAWCGSLAHNNYDNNVSRLTGNVLRRFAADRDF